MAIEQVKCRARVEIAGITIVTPYVQSFNVRKQRGQVSTFDATLKIPSGVSANLSSGDVKIYAGRGSADTLIFTGVCRNSKVSPCYDDPQYVILSVSGADKMSLLQNKKYTRRCRSTAATWCAITGVTRRGLKSGKFAFNLEPVLELGHGELEKQKNLVGTRALSVADENAPTKALDGENIVSPVPKVEIITPSVGGA